jgi:hypothetical protein
VTSGEIVGVVSRGGSCSAHGNLVYTRVDEDNRLASAAFLAAEKESKFASNVPTLAMDTNNAR